MLKHINWLLCWLNQNRPMLIRHAVFHWELFPWYIFLAECDILNFVHVGRHTHTASQRGWPLFRYQLNNFYCWSCYFFIQKFNCIVIQLSVFCPWRQHDVTVGKDYLTFSPEEYLFSSKLFLNILWKSTHFPRRYKRKYEWVFFFEHSVVWLVCG